VFCMQVLTGGRREEDQRDDRRHCCCCDHASRHCWDLGWFEVWGGRDGEKGLFIGLVHLHFEIFVKSN
jgi:hypothetical protein